MASMSLRVLTLVASLLGALALAGTADAGASALTTDRGVVQSVSPTQIVPRELDGSVVPLAVGPRTRVLLNGAPSRLRDIRPGFVAAVVHNGSAPARAIKAFGRAATVVVDRGTIDSYQPPLLTVRRL